MGAKIWDPKGRRTYRVISGQRFWTELTGDPTFFIRLITLMKDIPEKHKEAYKPEWDAAINRLTNEFLQGFCFEDGHIDWEKLVKFVSAESKAYTDKRPGRVRRKKTDQPTQE